MKKKKLMAIGMSLSMVITPFITMHAHKLYKTALEYNFSLAYPNIEAHGGLIGFIAGFILFFAVVIPVALYMDI